MVHVETTGTELWYRRAEVTGSGDAVQRRRRLSERATSGGGGGGGGHRKQRSEERVEGGGNKITVQTSGLFRVVSSLHLYCILREIKSRRTVNRPRRNGPWACKKLAGGRKALKDIARDRTNRRPSNSTAIITAALRWVSFDGDKPAGGWLTTTVHTRRPRFLQLFIIEKSSDCDTTAILAALVTHRPANGSPRGSRTGALDVARGKEGPVRAAIDLRNDIFACTRGKRFSPSAAAATTTGPERWPAPPNPLPAEMCF